MNDEIISLAKNVKKFCDSSQNWYASTAHASCLTISNLKFHHIQPKQIFQRPKRETFSVPNLFLGYLEIKILKLSSSSEFIIKDKDVPITASSSNFPLMIKGQESKGN